MNIGKVLKKLRIDAGHVNMRKMCIDYNLDQSYISKLENDRQVPKLPYLERLADLYGCPVGIIFYLSLDESDIKNPDKIAAFKAIKPGLDRVLQDTFLIKI